MGFSLNSSTRPSRTTANPVCSLLRDLTATHAARRLFLWWRAMAPMSRAHRLSENHSRNGPAPISRLAPRRSPAVPPSAPWTNETGRPSLAPSRWFLTCAPWPSRSAMTTRPSMAREAHTWRAMTSTIGLPRSGDMDFGK